MNGCLTMKAGKKIFFKIFIISLLLVSCKPLELDVPYFQDAKNFETLVDTDTFTPTFKVNDIVSIFVSTFDVEASRPFNLQRENSGGGVQPIDYIVDIDGNIDFPVLGSIKLLGLTVQEAKELIIQKLSDGYLKDPIVNIRIQNFRVTVLGEVGRPGTYAISGERISLMEAIGRAGDLTIKAKRDNILIVRDFNGTKTYTRVNLNNKEAFSSPVYYLTQNDVIYVEPNHSGMTSARGDTRIGTVLAVMGLAVSIGILLTR